MKNRPRTETMRVDRLAFVIVILLVLGSQPVGWGQGNPGPRASGGQGRSLFGDRSYGRPLKPRPRYFGGGGMFGARPNFKRGFSAPMGINIWEDLPNPLQSSGETSLELLGRETRPVLLPPLLPAVVEPLAEVSQAVEGEPPQPGPFDGEPGQPPGEPGEPAAMAEQAVEQAAELMGAIAEDLGEGNGSVAAAPQPAAPRGRRTYDWQTGSLRRQPLESVLTRRLEKCLGRRLESPLEVSIQGGTATLRGVVATERDRVLAGHLARFEPGVQRVRNELSVAPETTSQPDDSATRIRLLPAK